MSRLCEDCGIPPWVDCQCDPRAGLDHPDPRNFDLPERPTDTPAPTPTTTDDHADACPACQAPAGTPCFSTCETNRAT